MPPSIFPAIVLKSFETGNTSEVVHVVSGERGRFSVYGKGLRSPKSPYRAVLQPLALVELVIYAREEAEMGTLREATLLDSHRELTEDLERFVLGLLLAETAAVSCHVGQPAPEVFESLNEALEALHPESSYSAAAGACLGITAILSAAGYEPALEPELLRPWPAEKPRPHCFWLDAAEGRIHLRGNQPHKAPEWPWPAAPTARQFPLPPQAIRFLFETLQGRTASLGNGEARQLLEGLVRLCEYHHDVPLRAAAFWRSLEQGH